jgi:carboxymethylenebutenolidase
MITQDVEILTADGVCDAVVFRPDTGARASAVIRLTDIGGIRPAQVEMAGRLAGLGYVVLMPNIFYRTRRPPIFDFPFNMAEERTQKRLAELREPLTPEAVERDATSFVDFLATTETGGRGMGVVGYCFSGSLAMRTAAARPDKMAAMASFHGGGLCTDAPTSPHLMLPRIKARLYFGHAVQDRSMPQEAIDKLNQALDRWGGRYESEVYEGAYHSWTTPDSPVYNQPQAERAFEKLEQLLAATLGSVKQTA